MVRCSWWWLITLCFFMTCYEVLPGTATLCNQAWILRNKSNKVDLHVMVTRQPTLGFLIKTEKIPDQRIPVMQSQIILTNKETARF